MRVEAIMPANIHRVNTSRKNYGQNIKTNSIQADTVSFKPRISMITFTGGGRNLNQIASFAYENRGTGLSEDYQGGLGVVTYEAPQSFIKHENLDARSFMPAHEFNNPKGGYVFLWTKDLRDKNGKLPEQIPANRFLHADPEVTLVEFAKLHNFDKNDLKYVIMSEPDGKEATSLTKYCIIEPTSARGEIERMSDDDLGQMQKVSFEIFKISKENPSYNKLKDTPNYWIWTKELAKTPKPYTYGSGGNDGIDAEINNSDYCRAYLQAERMMDTEEFGHWKPANLWGHDRPIASLYSHIASLSASGDDYYNGTRTHFSAHNPGLNYQGHTDNPFAFARILFDKDDIEALKQVPEFELINSFSKKGWHNLTDEEKAFTNKIFAPFIGKFKDFFNTYNLTKIPILAAKINPQNVTFGTVSPNFDKEMKNPDMDVAAGIGAELREIETISPLNGSTPANLGIDNNTSNFGRGNNGLSEHKSGFTPIKYNGNNIEEVIANRIKNAQWLTGLLEDAEKEGRDALNKVFFSDAQIEGGRSVFGSLSRFKPDEMLIMGWGRPDEQKGYPYMYKGFLKFLKREDVPEEIKLKVKLLNGAGDLPWDKNAKDFRLIQEILKEIAELDGGKYKHNAMYVDGLFPNKLVACATHCGFTSRREMCGITPLEAKTAGVPYLATKTGGPVDYTNESNGWLTKTAPEMNPPFDGLDWGASADEIDNKRIERISDEVSDLLKEITDEYYNHNEKYVAKCKKNIEEKLDWHNNSEFNNGKSANKMYRENVWKVDEGWEARNTKPLKRLVDRVNPAKKSAAENTESIEAALNAFAQKLQEIMNKTMTTAEENMKKLSEDMLSKFETTVKTTAEKAVEEITNTVKTTTAKAIEEISSTSVQNAADTVEKSVKGTKGGKLLAFGGGIAAAALGGGAWFFVKGKNMLEKAEKIMTTASPVSPAATATSGSAYGTQSTIPSAGQNSLNFANFSKVETPSSNTAR